MPGFIKPQLATLKTRAPKGDQWLHEIKFDGYRVQVHVNSGRKRVYTRNGLDWTKRFSTIAGALDIAGEAIIDGEVVVPSENGTTDFSVLQNELRGKSTKIVLVAFDLLYLNGYDLRRLPLIQRISSSTSKSLDSTHPPVPGRLARACLSQFPANLATTGANDSMTRSRIVMYEKP